MHSISQPKVRIILLLSANPRGTPQLRLDEEFRRITDALERSKQRNEFDIRIKPAITIAHIRRALLDHQPEIVHFCGHGEGTNGIACEDETGQVKLIPTLALANLFELVVTHVRCVVLNACYAEIQANEVAKHIECVVGMKYSVGDKAALSFAEGFYDALGVGKTFEECFLWGVNAIQLESIPEDSTPVFKKSGETYSKVGTSHPQVLDDESTPPQDMDNKKLWKLLLTISLVVALVTALVTWAISKSFLPQSPTPKMIGHYSQRDFGEPKRHGDFTIESVASSLVIYINPLNDKLRASEISTNQISYIEPNGSSRVVAVYTAEWRYDEVERFSITNVKMSAKPLPRYAFDKLVPLLKDSNINVNGAFNKYMEYIKAKYASAESNIELKPDGSILRTNWYEETVHDANTFYPD
jgi:hypothetical protein